MILLLAEKPRKLCIQELKWVSNLIGPERCFLWAFKYPKLEQALVRALWPCPKVGLTLHKAITPRYPGFIVPNVAFKNNEILAKKLVGHVKLTKALYTKACHHYLQARAACLFSSGQQGSAIQLSIFENFGALSWSPMTS